MSNVFIKRSTHSSYRALITACILNKWPQKQCYLTFSSSTFYGGNLQLCSPWQALTTIFWLKRSFSCEKAKKCPKILICVKIEVSFCLGPPIEKTNRWLFMSNMNKINCVYYFIHWTLKGNGPGLSYLYDDLEHLKDEFFLITQVAKLFVLEYLMFCKTLGAFILKCLWWGWINRGQKVSHLSTKSVAY